MKAVILKELNKPLEIEEIQMPESLSYGQVKIKILISGLCGAQLQEIKGLKNNVKFLPHLLGHEGCGLVEEVGPGVSKVKAGDKVVLHWRKSSGIESDFPNYFYNGKKITSGKITTLSEYSIISENRMTKVPSDSDNNFCALLGCGLSTGMSVVNKEAFVRFGESVLIIGCGGVGLNCVYAAKLSNASPIVGIDTNDKKRELINKNGGEFIHIDNVSTLQEKYKKFDCIIDTTGDLDILSEVLPLLSERGRCILVAQPLNSSSLKVKNPTAFFSTNGQLIKTTQAGGFDPDSDIINYLKLSQKIDLNNIITDIYPLNQINEAVEKLKSGTAGRILIKIC